MTNERSGYILTLTLLLLSLLSVIVSYMVWVGTAGSSFTRTVAAREKARELAYGGMQLAFSQLSLIETSTAQSPHPASGQMAKKEGASDKPAVEANTQEDAAIIWMKTILPVLNRVQRFELKEAVDGITATMGICITCEQGKLDINQLYDFTNKKFVGHGTPDDMGQLCQQFFALLKPAIKIDLFPPLEKFLKKREAPLDDITELLLIPEFAQAFKAHVCIDTAMPIDKKAPRPFAITDLFTLYNGSKGMNMLCLSDSIAGVLQLNRVREGDIEERIKHFASIFEAKDVHNKLSGTVETVWNNILKKPYGKEFKQVSTVGQKLCAVPNPITHFSIVVYAQVDGITEKIFAIIEKRMTTKEGKEAQGFIVDRLYWL
ncbi:MAG: hypothetical protein WCE21_02255 [Candidatus Babeliales bacterium]